MSLGSATFFVFAFLVSFTLPYLFDPQEAALGTNIGWIYGGGTILALLFVFFCVPESRGRTLEEISEMINAKVPTRQWTTYVTTLQREGGKTQVDPITEESPSEHSDEIDTYDKEKRGTGATGYTTQDVDIVERQ